MYQQKQHFFDYLMQK